MEKECKNKNVTLGVQFEKNEQTGMVRLVWSVKNGSAKHIRLHSYYCPFYERGKYKGIYVNGQWTTKERRIASRRIQTELYSEESRTFVWGFVEPMYYGLTTRGPWTYRLKLFYSVEDDSATKYVECESNPVEVLSSKMPEHLGDITSPQIIEAIYLKFPRARESSYAKELENELLEPRGRARRLPDAILDWNNRILLVLFKTFGGFDDLKQLEEMRNDLQETAAQYELKIEGVIVAYEPDKKLVSKIGKKPEFYLVTIGEPNIHHPESDYS